MVDKSKEIWCFFCRNLKNHFFLNEKRPSQSFILRQPLLLFKQELIDLTLLYTNNNVHLLLSETTLLIKDFIREDKGSLVVQTKSLCSNGQMPFV